MQTSAAQSTLDGTDEDPDVLYVPAGDTVRDTYKTLDDVRARLKVLADRKKHREDAGLVTHVGRQLAEALIKATWGVSCSCQSPENQRPNA